MTRDNIRYMLTFGDIAKIGAAYKNQFTEITFDTKSDQILNFSGNIGLLRESDEIVSTTIEGLSSEHASLYADLLQIITLKTF